MLCIGLDPHVSQLSDHTADAAAAFCINIIEKTHLYAAAYKPNSAFFEAFGAKGFDALIEVMKVIDTKIHIYNVYSLSSFPVVSRSKSESIHIGLKSMPQAIPSDIPVILDNKRGDIDTTAQAYATSSFEIFNASAVTLSPYMGWDSIQPFVTGCISS